MHYDFSVQHFFYRKKYEPRRKTNAKIYHFPVPLMRLLMPNIKIFSFYPGQKYEPRTKVDANIYHFPVTLMTLCIFVKT